MPYLQYHIFENQPLLFHMRYFITFTIATLLLLFSILGRLILIPYNNKIRRSKAAAAAPCRDRSARVSCMHNALVTKTCYTGGDTARPMVPADPRRGPVVGRIAGDIPPRSLPDRPRIARALLTGTRIHRFCQIDPLQITTRVLSSC